MSQHADNGLTVVADVSCGCVEPRVWVDDWAKDNSGG